MRTSNSRKSHPCTRLRSPVIHHQDDDFEVDRRDNSKAKAVHSATARCVKGGKLGRRIGVGGEIRVRRQVTTPSLGTDTRRKTRPVPSLLGRGVLRFLDFIFPSFPTPVCPSSPLIINVSTPVSRPFLCFPTASVFSIPNTIHTYSPSTPLVFRPIPVRRLVLLCCSLRLPYTKNERNGGQGRRAVCPGRRIELVDMTGRYSFSHVKGPMRNGSCVRYVFHVLKPTPPLPTQPFVSATLSTLHDNGLGLYNDHTRCTDERSLDA